MDILGIDSSLSTTTTTASGQPDFPAENPKKEELDKWIDTWDKHVTQSGFQPLLAGQDPPSLMHLKLRSLADIPELTADAGAGPVAARLALRAQVKHENEVKTDQKEQILRDHRHRLAVSLIAALRPHAGLRLDRLLEAHKVSGTVGSDDAIYDGIAMYKSLRALRTAALSKPQRDRIREKYDLFVSPANRLKDKCTEEEYSLKANDFIRNINPYLDRKYEGEHLGEFLIELMPDSCTSDGLSLMRDMRRHKTLSNHTLVVTECQSIVSAHAPKGGAVKPRNAPPPQASLTKKGLKALLQGSDIAALKTALTLDITADERAKICDRLIAVASHAPGRPSGGGGGRALANPRSNRLPDGSTCTSGTCRFKHEGECWRDPRVKQVPQEVLNNKAQLERIEADRKANAARLKVPYVPLQCMDIDVDPTPSNPYFGWGDVVPPMGMFDQFDDLSSPIGGGSLDDVMPTTDLGEPGFGDDDGDGAAAGDASPRSAFETPVRHQVNAASRGLLAPRSPIVGSASLAPIDLGDYDLAGDPGGDVLVDSTEPGAGGDVASDVASDVAADAGASRDSGCSSLAMKFAKGVFSVSILLTVMALIVLFLASASAASDGAALSLGAGTVAMCSTQGRAALAYVLGSARAQHFDTEQAGLIAMHLLGAAAIALALVVFVPQAGLAVAKSAGRSVIGAIAAGGGTVRRYAARLIQGSVFLMVILSVLAALPRSEGAAVAAARAVSVVSTRDAASPFMYHTNAYLLEKHNITTLPPMMANADLAELGELVGARGKTEPRPTTLSWSDLCLGDSGAALHAVPDETYGVPGSKRANTTTVCTASGRVTPPWKIDCEIPVKTVRGKRVKLRLEGCILMEDCPHVLISLGRLAAHDGVGTWIAPGNGASHLAWKDPKGQVHAVRAHNCGVLVVPTAEQASHFLGGAVTRGAAMPKSVDGVVLHQRFLHRHSDCLSRLPECTDAPAEWSDAIRKASEKACDDCLKSTADRQGSSAHAPPVAKAGDLVSFDIWEVGVGHVHGGQKLVINFHDHHSGVNKPYLLAHYSDAPAALDKYCAWANGYGVSVKRFHTDNGTTLVSREMRELIASKNAHLTTIAPHVPRQNGMCERQWRSLASDTRKLLSTSSMPRSFWWYAFRHAASVQSVLPIAGTRETGWTRFTNQPSTVRNVRVWGCVVYPKIYNPVTKVHDQSERHVYIGRAPDQPGFVCFDPRTNRILVTPHCSFVETSLPGLRANAAGEPDVFPEFARDHEEAGPHVSYDAPDDAPVDDLEDPAVDPTVGGDAASAGGDGGGADDGAGGEVASGPRTRRRAAQAAAPHMPFAGRTRHGSNYTAAVMDDMLSAIPRPPGRFVIYLGSGVARAADLPSQLWNHGVHTVSIDIKRAGYAHDLRDPVVVARLIDLATDPDCIGVMVSVPCGTFSAARFNPGPAPVLRDAEHPSGIPRADGSLPKRVQDANQVVDGAMDIARAAAARGRAVVIESPVPRKAGELHAIPGRENHASMWEYPAVARLVDEFSCKHVDMDQCMCGAASQKTTRLMASPPALPALRTNFGSLCCDGRHVHAPLVGPPEKGKFKTSDAEAYPPEMNRRLAEVFAAAARDPLVAWASFLLPGAFTYSVFTATDPAAGGVGSPSSWVTPEFDADKIGCGSDSPYYNQTLRGPEAPLWRRSREAELDNLMRHGAIELVPEDTLPSWDARKRRSSEVIDTMWVFKRKRDANNKINRYKARITLRGDQQKQGAELNTFAPTVRHSTFRMLNAAGCLRGARMRSFDVEAAFLQGHRDNLPIIHARPPPMNGSAPPTDDRGVPLVWKMRRPIYGDAEAPRIWYMTLGRQLEKQGFMRSEFDPCYYYKEFADGARIDMSIYVDDSWVCDTAGERCDHEIAELKRVFTLTMDESPDSYLGMNIHRPSSSRVTLSSTGYIKKLVLKYLPKPLESYYKYAAPADRQLHSHYESAVTAKSSKPVSDALLKVYRSLVGALIYVVPSARPDVAHPVGILARALTFPTEEMLSDAHRVVAFLGQHGDLGLTYDARAPNASILEGYSDSDWGVTSSTTGYVIKLAGGAVAWASRRQHSISMSTTEAEIIAASDAALEIVYLRGLLSEMGYPQDKPTTLYVDNAGAVELSRDLKSCQRSRHVERRYLKVRELVAAGHIEVKFTPTADNQADIFTKSSIDAATRDKHVANVMNTGGVAVRRG